MSAMNVVWLGQGVLYQEALVKQEEAVRAILEGKGDESLFLLEHASVYTIGRTRNQSSLRESERLPFPVVETNRGGQATYHGPGQLVGYPILDLRQRGSDLHVHLRRIEEGLIETCQGYGILATRREGLTGVWVEDRKIASIGVGVRKWISMHGFAINITLESLDPFQHITPCGLSGVQVTCLHRESRECPTPHEFGRMFAEIFQKQTT